MKPTQAKREISDTILSANNRLPEDNLNIYFEGIKMMIYLNNVYSENILKVIIDTIVATGYFISQYKVSSANIDGRILKSENEFFKNLKKITNFTFICEPKWDLSVKNIPKKIYHITLTKYTDNILKNGLLPSSEKKKGFHPERNYFCKNYKDVSVMLLSFIKNDIFNRNYYDKEERLYSVLEINTTNLKSIGFDGIEYDIVFYKDENSSGIYTYDLIKPSNIKLIDSNINSYL